MDAMVIMLLFMHPDVQMVTLQCPHEGCKAAAR
jgi:hypothetical protein